MRCKNTTHSSRTRIWWKETLLIVPELEYKVETLLIVPELEYDV